MLKFHLDALAAIDRQEGRADAVGLNAFFSNQLEQVEKQVYEKKFPELKGRKLVPVKNDIDPGAMSLTERAVEEIGAADYLTDVADNAPNVEIAKSAEDTYHMRGIAVAYGWTLQEMRSAQFAGLNLDTRKAMAARRAIERFIDKNLLIGGSTAGYTLYGLFTLANAVAPWSFTDHGLTGEFKDNSGDDQLRALRRAAMYAYTQTKEIETVDTLVIAPTVKAALTEKRIGDANSKTVLQAFLDDNDFVKNVETSHYLEPSGGYGGGASASRLVFYRHDPEVIEGLVNEFEQLPPEYRSMRTAVTCIARVGGVKARLPKGIVYMDVTHSG